MTTPTPPTPPAPDEALTVQQLHAGIDHLIERYLADTTAIPTAWVLHIATVEAGTAEYGTAGYGLHYPAHQAHHITRGLLANASNRVDAAQQRDLYAYWAGKDAEGNDQ